MRNNTNNLIDMSSNKTHKSYNMNEITLKEVAQVLQACINHDNSAGFESNIITNNPKIKIIFDNVMEITQKMIDEKCRNIEQIKRAMTIMDNLNLVMNECLCELDIFTKNMNIPLPARYKLSDEVIQKLLYNPA
ncbi:MAG: hypothetical protein RLZZ210_1236 [Pseudomonadota bacterium]|jgi:hypothetical protein